jgi:hypothetical protein
VRTDAGSTIAGTDRVEPSSEGERELARALALLEGDQAGSVTIAALRERGVKAPAQAMYDLQLAGYAIDRISCTDPRGHRTFGYRLHGSPAPVSTRPRSQGVTGGGT